MAGTIYNITDGGLVEMHEELFATEDDFQTLLQQYPNLLAGDQIDATIPRRWLLVRREMGVAAEADAADRWSLDHLFLDQEAIPTLVEVKRSTDTRIRREVVGQVLDYAANAVVHWSIDRIQEEYAKTCDADGADPDERLAQFLQDELQVDEFWARVKTNLQAERIRMLFVADVIPPELRRIIEFLNKQMDPAEVLGVELKHYVGAGLKTLVPRVIGSTAEAEQRKAAGSPTNRNRLSAAELQQIADERGVGEIYTALARKLSLAFPKTTTSLSTLSFVAPAREANGSTTRNASYFSLIPGNSSPSQGVAFAVFMPRLVQRAALDDHAARTLLPPIELDPEWRNGRHIGYAKSGDLDAIVDRLVDAES